MATQALLLTVLLYAPAADPAAEIVPSGREITVTQCPLATIITGPAQPQPGGTKPAAPAAAKTDEPPAENLVTFDPGELRLDWSQSNWQLRSGTLLLKDLGRNETAGRQLLQALRELRVTQHGTVGSPKPVLEYWLTDGQAPCGLASGLRVFRIDPRTLRVERVYGQWCVRDVHYVLLNFEDNEEDARNALAVLRKYHFTQVGSVGSANPPLLLFLTRPGEEAVQYVQPQQGPTAAVLPTAGPGLAVPQGPAKDPVWRQGNFAPQPGGPR